jgi:hypothetical protein
LFFRRTFEVLVLDPEVAPDATVVAVGDAIRESGADLPPIDLPWELAVQALDVAAFSHQVEAK